MKFSIILFLSLSSPFQFLDNMNNEQYFKKTLEILNGFF